VTFDDGNPAWEDIPEEDEKIEEMRWAAEDRADFGAANMPTNEAADKAITLLRQTVQLEMGRQLKSIKYWRDFWRTPVRSVLIIVLNTAN
jgi:hypothetical protein